ncbi:MAG: HD domain-containing protein [Candidatus Parcubacteria bacterium]|nr:HD domain-containing protein [Candidatus Parcubacteria bacterium]
MNLSETGIVKPINKAEIISQEIVEFKKAVAKIFKVEVSAKIYDALDLMIELHSDQKDSPNGKPYISHPLEVAADLINKYNINDPDLIIAGLLHDAVEDQKLKLQAKWLAKNELSVSPEHDALMEIRSLFGERVKKIVARLTNPDFTSIQVNLKSQGVEKTKHQLYKENVKDEIRDPETFVIKFADFARNALHLDKVPDGPRKENFKLKYGPVIKEVFLPAFKSMAQNHPLYQHKKEIIKELNAAFKKYYS